jgi:hypothetical protein
MDSILPIAVSFIAALVSMIASLLFKWLASVRKNYLKTIREQAEQRMKSAIAHEISHLIKVEKPESKISSSPISSISKEDIKNEIDGRVDSLKKRLSDIEKRFPKQETVDKVASVNDAILATQIEGISESLKNIESKIITRWDVAK